MPIFKATTIFAAMPRPFHCRTVTCMPACNYFKPQGIPLCHLAEVILTTDEFEAIRLADLEGLYQEDAAIRMKVSRQTFARIIKSARRKVGEVLVNGKALKIEGGHFKMKTMRKFRCSDCEHIWDLPHGTWRPGACPRCKSENFHRMGCKSESHTRGEGCLHRHGRQGCRCRGKQKNAPSSGAK